MLIRCERACVHCVLQHRYEGAGQPRAETRSACVLLCAHLILLFIHAILFHFFILVIYYLIFIRCLGGEMAMRVKSQFRMHANDDSFLAQCRKLGFVETLAVTQVCLCVCVFVCFAVCVCGCFSLIYCACCVLYCVVI